MIYNNGIIADEFVETFLLNKYLLMTLSVSRMSIVLIDFLDYISVD
jgi:hypothetical protein